MNTRLQVNHRPPSIAACIQVVLFSAIMSIQAVPSVAKTGYPLLNYTSLDSVAIDSLLFKISQAQKKISYSGTLERETSHAGKPMLLRWQVHHWAPSQTLVHFLEPEALQNTVIYNDGKVFKTTGDSHVARSMRRSGISRALQEGQLLEEIELLSQNYVISLQNGADYIGRKVLELKIEPKRNGRPSYFAKVDAEMGVLLETRRMPANIHADSLVQVSRFITIRYGFPDDSLKYQNFTTVDSLRQRAGATQFHDIAALIGYYKETLLIPSALPSGFALRRIRAFQKEDRAFVHLQYSDGLSMISLFQRKNGDTDQRKNRGKWGGDNAQLSMVQGEKSGVHYHIVGEIAEDELQEMAAGLVPITRKSSANNLPIYFIIAGVLIATGIYLVKRFMEKTNV